ncbi:MAG: 16S rRNA (uracil(1498)-N(3))-methyltransferase [Streptosporangiales bacterium]|nr:16S rRNA (uracil(1498)-N(3))-methyltransferase [Streptosporangiales bacterium]
MLDTAGPPVFLVPPGSAEPGGTITLDGPEGHHASSVRRLRAGERADVSDGSGTLASCEVTAVGTGTVDLLVRSVTPVPPASPAITVVQALPKGDRGELAVEMMTEIGADAIVAWQAARSVARWQGARAEKSLEKWRRTAREAAKQARRAWIPPVTGPAGLDDVRELVSSSDRAIVLEAAADAPLSGLDLPGSGSIVLVVGPEGGLTPDERTALVGAGATEARLGPTVLRTSTAGAAASSVLLTRSGRW